MKVVLRYADNVKVISLPTAPRVAEWVVVGNNLWQVNNVKWDLSTEDPFVTIYLDRLSRV